MKNTGTALVVVLVVVLLLLLVSGVGMMGFGGFGMGGMMGGYGGYRMMGGYGWNPLGVILSLIFWALIVGGIVLLVVWLLRNPGRVSLGASSGVDTSPLDILKVRYAKGEITREQFEGMRHDLGA